MSPPPLASGSHGYQERRPKAAAESAFASRHPSAGYTADGATERHVARTDGTTVSVQRRWPSPLCLVGPHS